MRIPFVRPLIGLLWLAVVPAHLAAGTAPIPTRTRDQLAAGRPVTIVCFGDSITGVYYHTGGRRAYPEMLEVALRSKYPKAPVKVVNAGVSGHTTREAVGRLDRDVLAHKPNLVAVMFGMNDMVRVPLAEFRKNMVEIKDRCQKAGAEVVFCTQNNVLETPGRPAKRLAEITQAIRDLAREHTLAVADCHSAYEAARAKDAAEWRLLLSDEIHPNMDGHKLLAETLAQTIAGSPVSLRAVGPPTPAIPRTLDLLRSGKPIRVFAMPPFDREIAGAIKAIDPKATVEVRTWQTEGKTLAQIETAAKAVRGMGVDLVILAVPDAAEAPDLEGRIRSYSWILNWSLSFGRQEWDVVAAPPSTASPQVARHDALARRLIAAQDLTPVTRIKGEEAVALETVVRRWVREQAGRK